MLFCVAWGGCQVVLEADRDGAPADAAPVDAQPVDAEPDVGERDAGCLPVPPLVRFEDVPVGEVAAAAVPLGCGSGLAVQAARLERVTPTDAFALPDPLPAVPVDHLRLTYHPRLVAEQASAVLVLTSQGNEYTVPIAGSARWTDAACRHWEVAALATGAEGLYRLEATPPRGGGAHGRPGAVGCGGPPRRLRGVGDRRLQRSRCGQRAR